MTQRTRMRIVLWLVIVVVFVLGCVTGASLDSLYRSRAGGPRGEMRGMDQISLLKTCDAISI